MITQKSWRLSIFIFLVMIPIPATANEGIIDIASESIPFTNLNLRFSNRPLSPPDGLIVQTIPLTDIKPAHSFVAPSPQAVIFEDDQRQRLAILSTNETENLILFLLETLPLDPKLPSLVQCAHDRDCHIDRTPLTGGIGCVALCLKELLETAASGPANR